MIFEHTKTFEPLNRSRIYLYAGGKESEQHLPNVQKLEAIIRKKMVDGHQIDLHFSVNEDASHNEVHWREEFPLALKWLYFK